MLNRGISYLQSAMDELQENLTEEEWRYIDDLIARLKSSHEQYDWDEICTHQTSGHGVSDSLGCLIT